MTAEAIGCHVRVVACSLFFCCHTLPMKRIRKLEFILDDSSLSTPQELEGLKGTWITVNKDGEERQIFIPKLDYVCPCCKRPNP